MEHIYEYLIGGRKTGMRKSLKWGDLGIGDTVYYWVYADSSWTNPDNTIMILTIKNIKITNNNVAITTATIHTEGYDKHYSENTFNFLDPLSSTGKMVDNDGLKLYCATTLKELEKIVPEEFFKTAKISDLTKK